MVSPNGRHALSGSSDRTLRLWNLGTGAELACLSFDAVPLTFEWSKAGRRRRGRIWPDPLHRARSTRSATSEPAPGASRVNGNSYLRPPEELQP